MTVLAQSLGWSHLLTHLSLRGEWQAVLFFFFCGWRRVNVLCLAVRCRWLAGCQLGVDGAVVIADAIPRWMSLSHLDLSREWREEVLGWGLRVVGDLSETVDVARGWSAGGSE